jgi:hypothetical protein
LDIIVLGLIVMGLVILLDLVIVYGMMRYGVRHLEHGPSRAEDSGAVMRLKAINAERQQKAERAQALALAAPTEEAPAEAAAKPRASSRRRAAATAEGS